MVNTIVCLILLACFYSVVSVEVVDLDKSPEEVLQEMFERIYMTSSEDDRFDIDDENSGLGPQVRTSSGLVIGSNNSYANSFFAIPYAVPPIDELRYQPPQMLETPEVIRKADTRSRIHCHQMGARNATEDCLVLNVHVPQHVDLSDPDQPPSDRLPVMFWIHGGAFILGSGMNSIYDGRFLSQATNTIVVSVNYRLGPLGFLVYGEGENAINGNQGIKDQQLAMQWVQNNIEKFGGDKEQVTIFGESAGGQSVMLHLLSEVSDPLFHRGIMQSNPAVYTYPTREEAQRVTDQVVESLRCNGQLPIPSVPGLCCNRRKDNLTCLMDAEPSHLMAAMAKIHATEFVKFNILNAIEPFRPHLDGVEFRKPPLELFKEGRWNKNKPFIIGTNSEEASFMAYLLPMNELMFRGVNRLLFKDLGKYDDTGDRISEFYIKKYGADIKHGHIFGTEMTDIFFNCPSRALARFASETAEKLVHLYVFSHVLDGEDCEENLGFLCGHSYHGHELYFVFRTIEHMGMIADPEDTHVCDQFSTYWGSFAQTGDPSSGLEFPLEGEFPDWSPYKNTSWPNLRFDEPKVFMETRYTEDTCDFWDSLGLYMEAVDLPATTMKPPTTTTMKPPTTTTMKPPTTTTMKPLTTTDIGEPMTTSDSTVLGASMVGTSLFAIISSLKFV